MDLCNGQNILKDDLLHYIWGGGVLIFNLQLRGSREALTAEINSYWQDCLAVFKLTERACCYIYCFLPSRQLLNHNMLCENLIYFSRLIFNLI